ncbi:uncharacterized protein LOC134258600 [Saccostrea cucullata]|uniref:uncharacterized protein LOC134258600 n=1 Tax=Saccostrea cuccullata TaxID=36930 RepID=UPI002ED040C8
MGITPPGVAGYLRPPKPALGTTRIKPVLQVLTLYLSPLEYNNNMGITPPGVAGYLRPPKPALGTTRIKPVLQVPLRIKRHCLAGYKLENSECVECKTGYTGLKCEIKCPYPSYGSKCQQLCNCSETNCNSVSGCYGSLHTSSDFLFKSSTQNNGNPISTNNLFVANARAMNISEKEDLNNTTKTFLSIFFVIGIIGFCLITLMILNIFLRTPCGEKVYISLMNR